MKTWSYGSVEMLNDDVVQAETKYDCMAIGVACRLKELATELKMCDSDNAENACRELKHLLNALEGAAYAIEWAKEERDKALAKQAANEESTSETSKKETPDDDSF